MGEPGGWAAGGGLPAGRVDLHSHVLPGLDDGPADLDTALQLLRAAAADGTGAMVSTGHSAEVLHGRLDRAALEDRAGEVRRAAATAGIGVALLIGVEIFLERDTPRRLERGELCGLNGGRYLLVEPPFRGLPAHVDPVLSELQAAGYLPIIAHPERNATVQAEPRRLYDWATRGLLLQLSASSVLGGNGRGARRAAETALAGGWAHVLASDAHDPWSRPPLLRAAAAIVAERHGAATARALTDITPRAIVEDRPLTQPAPRPPEDAPDARGGG